MSREEREWNKKFISYMNMIVNHPNYKGLPIKRKVDGTLSIAPAKSDIGQARIDWCLNKAEELGIENRPGVYADVMLAIHPTKWKVCQTCGKSMSLYYHYPNAVFLKSLNNEFNSEFTDCDHISDIWDELVDNGVSVEHIASFLINKAGLTYNPNMTNKNEIIDAIELLCRKGGKKLLGPGAMSNFPDRYDGFHTYNRCCRASQDKGRSKENLKSYTKDRRAYEYWSDGNIHAANQFMGSSFFKGVSADHIGPISLGFVHDPRYLQPMTTNDNSSKRDRLLYEDIEKINETYTRTNIYPMSWYSKHIWEYIRNNYKNHPELVSNIYRDALKQNMSNFMFILWYILLNCPNFGEYFLERTLLYPHYEYFNYSYNFNEFGEIISQIPRHFTGRNTNEIERYKRIAFESVYDYNNKSNRHVINDLTIFEINLLDILCRNIESGFDVNINFHKLTELVEHIEFRIINNI